MIPLPRTGHGPESPVYESKGAPGASPEGKGMNSALTGH